MSISKHKIISCILQIIIIVIIYCRNNDKFFFKWNKKCTRQTRQTRNCQKVALNLLPTTYVTAQTVYGNLWQLYQEQQSVANSAPVHQLESSWCTGSSLRPKCMVWGSDGVCLGPRLCVLFEAQTVCTVWAPVFADCVKPRRHAGFGARRHAGFGARRRARFGARRRVALNRLKYHAIIRDQISIYCQLQHFVLRD